MRWEEKVYALCSVTNVLHFPEKLCKYLCERTQNFANERISLRENAKVLLVNVKVLRVHAISLLEKAKVFKCCKTSCKCFAFLWETLFALKMFAFSWERTKLCVRSQKNFEGTRRFCVWTQISLRECKREGSNANIFVRECKSCKISYKCFAFSWETTQKFCERTHSFSSECKSKTQNICKSIEIYIFLPSHVFFPPLCPIKGSVEIGTILPTFYNLTYIPETGTILLMTQKLI